MKRFALLLAPLVLASCGALKGSPPTADPLRSEDPDIQFMVSAAAGNLFEIETSRAALERSNNAAVRTYAQRMIDEHQTAQQELTQLATARDIPLPTQPDPPQRAIRDRLRAFPAATTGGDTTLFDQLYGKAQLDGHQLTLDTYNSYLKTPTADDAELKAYASKYQPTIVMHRDDARGLPQPPTDAQPLNLK